MTKIQVDSNGKAIFLNNKALEATGNAPIIQALNVTPATSIQTIVAPTGIDGYSPVNVAAVTSSIDNNIIAGNIKKDVQILGVTGTVEELNGETKVITPTTSQQIITPSSGKNAITQATVEAVTSSIDNNIVAGNIKKDVQILGVTGTLEGGITPTGTINITENGTVDVTNYASANVNVSGGGSGSTNGFLVQVIDYDGTVLKSERLDEGDTFTLPSQPSHTGLVFQSWSSPVTITNNTVTVTDSDITIGATYTTASGLSEFDITLTTATGLNVYLNMDGTKDWGDGTSDTGTIHAYSSAGDYTITCDGSTMTTSSSGGLFGQDTSTMSDYVKDVRLGSSLTSIGSNAFYGCHSLTSITIPSSITRISSYAFQNCYSLTSITIPSSITSIGNYVFSDCRSLTSITIPSSITSIGNYAFSKCYSLTSITISEGVTSIGIYAFQNCYSLTSITIPSSIASISDRAFQSCYSLTSITISEGVTSIGTYAFQGCYSLTSITIPSSTTSIMTSAFNNCYSLTSIAILSSITNIGTYAFSYCYSLTNITIPEDATSISNGAFYGCHSLTSIAIPEGATSIMESAFNNCYSLTSITMPSSIISIDSRAFYNCFSILEYDFSNHTAVPTLSNTNAFTNINKICRIKVPASLEAEWKAATNWSTYANYIVGV